jgi:hypothetical protein
MNVLDEFHVSMLQDCGIQLRFPPKRLNTYTRGTVASEYIRSTLSKEQIIDTRPNALGTPHFSIN